MRHTLSAFLAFFLAKNIDSLSIETETFTKVEAGIDSQDITLLYDYEGTDREYGVHVESGMYGRGSEFVYDEDHVIHLDGSQQDSHSKRFYKVPDTPPEHEGIQWLDPLTFDLTSIFDLGGFSQRYPNGPGWFAHLIHDDVFEVKWQHL